MSDSQTLVYSASAAAGTVATVPKAEIATTTIATAAGRLTPSILYGHKSPISRLPPELLEHIFGEVHNSLHFEEIRKVQIRLAQVCYLWRDLMFSRPKLWSKISVTELSVAPQFRVHLSFETPTPESMFPGVVEQLKLAGNESLSLFINLRSMLFNPSLSDEANKVCRFVMPWHAYSLSQLFLPVAGRIRRLDIYHDLPDVVEGFCRGLSGTPMPSLVTWNVHRRMTEARIFHPRSNYRLPTLHDSQEPPFFCIPPAMRDPASQQKWASVMYPKLQHLSLMGFPVYLQHLAARNLRFLEFGHLPLDARPNYQDLAVVLRNNAHSLELLHLQCMAPLSCNYYDPIVLPRVQTFVFGFSHPEIAVGLVRCLRLPNLRDLRIREFRSHSPAVNTEERIRLRKGFLPFIFSDMMTHWPLHQVTDLGLFNVEMAIMNKGSQALAFFNRFSSLRRLTLYEPHCTVLQGLAFPVYNPPALDEATLVSPMDVDAPSTGQQPQPVAQQNEGEQSTEQGSKAAPVEVVQKYDLRYFQMPCPNLNMLGIATKHSKRVLIAFLEHLSYLTIPSPRQFDVIVLDVPPEWGSSLRPVISRTLTRTVLNGGAGYFISGPLEGEQKAREVPNAAPMPLIARKVTNLMAA